MIFRPLHRAASLLSFGFIGCGAPSAAPVSPEPVVPEAALAQTCPVDLGAVRAAGWRVNYTLSDLAEGSLRRQVRPDGNEGNVEFDYVLRDANGLEEGVEQYHCSPDALYLSRVGPTDRYVTFDPPIPVLPFDASDGTATGTMTLTQGDDTRSWPYRFAYQAQTTLAYGPLRDRVAPTATWWTISSVLLLDADVSPTEWSTTTIWAVGPETLFVAERDQAQDGWRRMEAARSLSTSR